METKRLITLIIFSMAFMALWMLGVQWIAERGGYDLQPARSVAEDESTDPTDDDTGADSDAATRPTTGATRPATGVPNGVDDPEALEPGTLRILTETEPQQIGRGSLEANDPTWSMHISFDSVGAGVDAVVLNKYRQVVDSDDRYRFEEPYEESFDATRPLATESITVNGQTISLIDKAWAIDPAQTTDEQVVFYLEIGQGDQPLLRLEKLFRLYPRTVLNEAGDEVLDPRGGYEILVRQTIRNLTDEPIEVASTLNGTTVPPRELDYGYDRLVVAGYRDRNNTIDYQAIQVEQFDEDEPSKRLITDDTAPLLWAGTSTIYFNAIIRPIPLRAAEGEQVPVADFIRQITAKATNPDSSPEQRHVALSVDTQTLRIPAGGRAELPFRVFFGPKTRELLKNNYYSAGGLRYDETLKSPFGCTWCVFQPVVDVLVFLLSTFYLVLRDWGLAIIALVVVVRLLLHPITKKSQRSMMRMGKLGPEMERLKKKYGDDKEAMAKAMGEFYREHGLASLPLGCLPMLLQTPIWIALYSTLQAEFRLRHEPFLYGWTWIDDLAKPDMLIEFARPIPLLFFSLDGVNILPILLAVVFWINMKLMPTPAAATPEQQTQQTMMKWMMVLMFPIFLYKAPSGLNLYIITSTLIGIFETRRIRAQYDAEEAEKAAQTPVKVKDKAPRGRGKGGRGKDTEPPGGPPTPPTAWRGKLARLQENLQRAVEEAQKEAGKRASEKKKR